MTDEGKKKASSKRKTENEVSQDEHSHSKLRSSSPIDPQQPLRRNNSRPTQRTFPTCVHHKVRTVPAHGEMPTIDGYYVGLV